MTLLEAVWTWWRGATPVPDHQAAVAPPWRPQPRVPAEYMSLHTYLDRRYASTVVLTFEQVEALLGFALPGPARTQPDWWTGAAVQTGRHSEAWTVAGRTATPNLLARTVAFERLP
jgi:hypothetical protein